MSRYFLNGFLNIPFTLFVRERSFDSCFGCTAGFFASRFGVAVGDGDGEGDGSTVGLGLALTTTAAPGEMDLRDLMASISPTSSKVTTTAAIIFRFVFDLSVPLTDTETLGK